MMKKLNVSDSEVAFRILDKKGSAGAVALVMTLILMTLSTIIILFAANFGTMHNKSISNLKHANHAFEAAQAGMDFGINYLRKKSGTILANKYNGYILPYSDSNTSNVTLANNSKYTIVYSNPVQNNYDLILITSTGASEDGTATRVTTQLVEYGSVLLNQPDRPMISTGNVTLSGTSRVINMSDDQTIIAGGNVNLTGSSFTYTSEGISSTSGVGNLGSDVTQNDSTLHDMSSDDLFVSYFGLPKSLVKSSAGYVYSSNSDKDYSSDLNGKNGTSIFIDQSSGDAIISGTTSIGTFTNPVLLIIDGNTIFTNTVTLYGFLYVTGSSISIGGNTLIVGGFSSADNTSIGGDTQVIYSQSVLNNLQDHSNSRYYAKVPGSWKDF